MENNSIQTAGHAVAYTIGSIFKHKHYRLCAAVFHEYFNLKRQLFLACRRNTYI